MSDSPVVKQSIGDRLILFYYLRKRRFAFRPRFRHRYADHFTNPPQLFPSPQKPCLNHDTHVSDRWPSLDVMHQSTSEDDKNGDVRNSPLKENGAIRNGLLKPWKKNLYSNEGYPDNYTDKSFLEELRKNLHVRKLTLLEAILGASLVTQRLCIVVIFALSFYALNSNLISPLLLLSSTTAFYFILYLLLYENSNSFPYWLVKNTGAFIISGYVLSPVLKTLTETISTDTIYASTIAMMCVHLVFFDYGVPAVIVSTSLSLNAALFASICLCSRLQTSFHVFVFLSISVQCFALSPLLLSPIKSSIPLLLSFVTITLILCMRVSLLMSVLFVCTIIFINLVCPYYFVKWHSFKDNIYGPWDEAIVQDIKI